MEKDRINSDDFFVIESDNLTINSKLFGYMITENNIVYDETMSNDTPLTGNGVYIYISDDSNKIVVSQDFIGSYGLYYYENEDYFALSNSFVKLVEVIKEKFLFSLNEDFSKIFLSCSDVFSFNDTLINEIKLIPKDCKVIIHKNDKKIVFEQVDYEEKSIDLNSQQGMDVLDSWFNKWIKILRELEKQSGDMFIGLKDSIFSRTIISILLNANLNLDHFNIANISSDNHNTNEMTLISELTGIKFNKKSEKKDNLEDIASSIEKSFNTKLCSYNQMNYENNLEKTSYLVMDEDIYFNNGWGYDSIDDLINTSIDHAKNYSREYSEITERFCWDSVHKVQKHIKSFDIYSPNFLQAYLNHTLLRNKVGKDNVEKYLSNLINLNPLLDVELQRLTLNDKFDFNRVLFSVILLRYSPDFETVPLVDLNIGHEIIAFAKEINKKYPYEKQDYGPISTSKINHNFEYNDVDSAEIEDFVKKVFFSNSFKQMFIKYYPSKLYDNISRNYMDNKNVFMEDVYGATAIVKVLNDMEYNHNKFYSSQMDWLKTFVTANTPNNDSNTYTNHLLNKYITARIDIKNEGSLTNQIVVCDISDDESKIIMPDWFTNDKGEGVCISSDKTELHLKIKCINDGLLKINLRTLDIRDRNNKRFPIYIDYLSLKIDGNEYLKENKLIWHDKPYYVSKKVFNNEIIKIDLKWKPFNNLSNYEN